MEWNRTSYLDMAKMNRGNKKMVMICFKNYVRALNKERDAAGTATQDIHLKNKLYDYSSIKRSV